MGSCVRTLVEVRCAWSVSVAIITVDMEIYNLYIKRIRKRKKIAIPVLTLGFIFTLGQMTVIIQRHIPVSDNHYKSETYDGTNTMTLDPVEQISRTDVLAFTCDRYNTTSAPEFKLLHSTPGGPGVETVLLPGDPPVTVCIPHKVGSHAWGEFSRYLAEQYPKRMDYLKSFNWTSRSSLVKRAVVVRHPYVRLVSAYRMIFQDWCDQNKFIRGRWKTICRKEILSKRYIGESDIEKVSDDTKSVTKILSALFDEYNHGQDRYIARIWYKFHPEQHQDPEKMFKFTFQEFVRLLVNGTKEFEDDPYVLSHKSISYHWDPYYKECPVCHQLTRPDYILHMETLETDLDNLLDDVRLSQHRHKFPHTHTQIGGPSEKMTRKYLSELGKNELAQLREKYRIDFELFGYS